MTEGGESRPLSVRRYTPWVLGTVGVVAAVYAGAIDQRHTAAKVPMSFSIAAYHRTQQLDQDFERRAWIYAGVAALSMALAAAVAVARARSVAERRRVFAQAGVVGILLAFAGIILRWQVHSPIEPMTATVLLPSALMLAIAGIGGVVSRFQGPPVAKRKLGPVPIGALACTAITVICALAYGIPQNNDCSGNAPPAPGWTDTVASLGYLTGFAAIILAFVGLAERRWFVALICFVVNPAAFFYAVAASGAGC